MDYRYLAGKRTEDGQALVVVLLVIVIALVIALAIAFRVVQDIRKTAEQRSSQEAASQVDSMLEVVTKMNNIERLWDEGICDPAFPDECTIDRTRIALDILDEPSPDNFKCEGESQIRIVKNLGYDAGIVVNQDDVLELDLSEEVDADFHLAWEGVADYVTVKVYGNDGEDWVLNSYASQNDNPVHPGWQNIVTADFTASWPVSGEPGPVAPETVLARIKPVGGQATLYISDLQTPQLYAVKASCYMGSVYREFVRIAKIKSSVPSCFDYVLFDGTQWVKKKT
jgi:type II secretory pathway pseudopilin PulG